MNTGLARKILFFPASILLLACGLAGLEGASHRPAVDFDCVPDAGAVKVTGLLSGGAAERTGLRIGDRVVEVGGRIVRSPSDVHFQFLRARIGREIPVTVARDGETVALALDPRRVFGLGLVILSLLSGLFLWAIGVFVRVMKPGDRAARVFSWGCVVLAAALMMVWPGFPHEGEVLDYLLAVVYFALYTGTPLLTLWFVLIYPRESDVLLRLPWLRYVLPFPAACLFALLALHYVRAAHGGSFQLYAVFSRMFAVFRGYLLLYVGLSVLTLVHSYRRARTKESRNRVRWILWGLGVGVGPFLVLWTLPQALGLPALIPEEVNYIFMVVVPLAFMISILKHHALDIQVVIHRSFVYALATGAIIGVYLGLMAIAGLFVHGLSPKGSSLTVIASMLVAAMLFAPLKRRVQTLVDKTFYRVRYNYRIATKEFGTALASCLHQDEVVGLLLRKADAAIPLEKAALLCRNPESGRFSVAGGAGLTEAEQVGLRVVRDAELAGVVDTAGRPLLRDALGSLREWPFGSVPGCDWIAVAVPVLIEQSLRAFLFIGPKRAGTRFSEEDLALVAHMAEEAVMAMDRLRLQGQMVLERAAKERLEELNRLKSEFVSHVSHELRTPLASMSWSVGNLLDGIPEEPSPKVKDYLMAIQDSSEHLRRMIENLLDLTRIEAGRIELAPQALNVLDHARAVRASLASIASKKRITVVMDVPEDLRASADPDCFRMVVSNLLDNALKFSPEGREVRVEAGSSEPAGREGDRRVSEMIWLSVADEGPGIPADMLTTVFDRFERVRPDRGGGERGLGLGLHISRQLVELHGGTIWVESNVGSGSRFTFTLPRAHMQRSSKSTTEE
jgi:signal transduction histidine kinase